MNDVSVIRVSRCGITRGTLSGKHVLTLIWMIMTGGSFKIVSNWVVLTLLGGNIFYLLRNGIPPPFVKSSGLASGASVRGTSGISVRGTVGLTLVRIVSNCFNFYCIDRYI